METTPLPTAPRVLFVGRTTLDVLYFLDRLPAEDTKAFASAFRAAPGGPATNAALTNALLGGQSLLISAVGGGPWAEAVRADFVQKQIQLLDLAAGSNYQTPLTTVLISAKQASRTIVNPPLADGPLPQLSATWREAVPASWGAIPPVLLSDGFHLVETLPLLATCKAAGAALCLDGGSWKPGTEQLAPLLTAAICSERFALPPSLRKESYANDGKRPDEIFAWFAAQGVPCVAVTRGARSILGWERGRHFEIEIETVEAADTLGAGDVLHGAFCYYYAQRPEFESALRQAAKIATRSCRSLGVQSWAPSAAV
jgi:sugar/nucleoside kinase (ribokinase family)